MGPTHVRTLSLFPLWDLPGPLSMLLCPKGLSLRTSEATPDPGLPHWWAWELGCTRAHLARRYRLPGLCPAATRGPASPPSPAPQSWTETYSVSHIRPGSMRSRLAVVTCGARARKQLPYQEGRAKAWGRRERPFTNVANKTALEGAQVGRKEAVKGLKSPRAQ